jgi:glycine/D-amino acid oxidase-like deaminating enzyme
VVAPDVIVIGGGLHGCSAALHLAQCGVAMRADAEIISLQM